MAHCVFFYAQARMWKFAANAACGPRGEWWRGTFPYSIYEVARVLIVSSDRIKVRTSN